MPTPAGDDLQSPAGAVSRGGLRAGKASKFFFEKKNQKTFGLSKDHIATTLLLNGRVFLFLFFQKKKILAY
jgi:hypothetical protein